MYEGKNRENRKTFRSAARIILNASYEERSTDLFNKLGWCTFDQRSKYKRLCMVYKSLNGLGPQYMKDMFQYTRDVHSHALRSTSTSMLFLTGGRTDFHKRRFSFIASKEWNDFPSAVKKCPCSVSLG